MLFRPSFVTLVLAVAALGAPVIRDAAQVEADIETLTADAQSLYESIDTFSVTDPNPESAFAMHIAALKLDSTIKDATTRARAGTPFTDSQADTITRLVIEVVPIIHDGLHKLVEKKPAADELHITAIAYRDLQALGADTGEFGQELLVKTPVEKKDTLNKEIKIVQDDISAAIEAYSRSN